MSRLLGRTALMGILMLAAGSALAVDTWEPYPVGLRAFEFYGLRYGHNTDGDDTKGYGLMGGPAVGLTGRDHVYLFTGLSSSDQHLGGVDFLTLGFFQNILDRGFDLDYWLEITAFGEGLGLASRAAGLELNFDGPRGGLLWRGAMNWENDGFDGSGNPVIGLRTVHTYGIFWQLSPLVQLLADMRQESVSDFESLADDNRLSSWALGYNRVLSDTTEFILEARAHVHAEGDRTWDFMLGWVVVW